MNGQSSKIESASDKLSSAPVKQRVNYWWALPVVVAIVAIVLLSYKVLVPTAKDPESRLYSTSLGYPAQQRRVGEPIQVEVATLSNEIIDDFIAASGETVGLVDVEIRPQLTGMVAKVAVEEGQSVNKGDILLQLEKAPAQDRLNRARAELAIAESDAEFGPKLRQAKKAELEATVKRAEKLLEIAKARFERYKGLKDERAASSEEYAAAEELYTTRIWELTTAESQLNQHQTESKKADAAAEQTLTIRRTAVNEAERDLAHTNIVAPCTAMVTSVNAQPGELAVQDLVAMTLADKMVFQAYIDQTGIDAVRTGDTATVRLIAYPGQQFNGTVIRVNPSVDTKGRIGERGRVDTRFTYSAWVKLEGDALPPGLQGHAEFHRKGTNAALPESAVIHLSGGEGMVMLIVDGRAEIRRVELGRVRGSLREIKSGVQPSDQVVLYPRGLEAGDLLSVAQVELDKTPTDESKSMLSQHDVN